MDCRAGNRSPAFRYGVSGIGENIKEHDRIVLAEDLAEYELQTGDFGTIVHVYSNERAYEVEFVTLTGKTVAVVTVPSDQIRTVREDEITHARPIIATG